MLVILPDTTASRILRGWEDWRFENWGPWLATRLLHAGLYILGAVLLDTAWRALLRRVRARVEEKDSALQSELDRRVQTLTAILRQVGTVLVYTSASLVILADFGLQVGPFIAGLGIIGVALGFGAQYLVQDWIAGFFTVLENQYRVGDVVQANTMTGTVERLTLRTTYLRAVGGEVHIIQNGTIRAVTNFTRQWSRAILDAGVDYRSDMVTVFDALGEVGLRATQDPEVGPVLLEPPEVLGVTQLAESQITVRLSVKTLPQRKWEVERFLRRTAVEVFAERGVSIPFLQRAAVIASSSPEKPPGGDHQAGGAP
jgi:small conductance mechanosensitive channel